MAQKSANADSKFRAFSDQTRLRILHLLLQGEMCVCDIVRVIRVPQPTASRHLANLRKAGLVTARREGLWMYYSLTAAKTIFDKKLRGCLANCFGEVSQIRADQTRLEKLRKRATRC